MYPQRLLPPPPFPAYLNNENSRQLVKICMEVTEYASHNENFFEIMLSSFIVSYIAVVTQHELCTWLLVLSALIKFQFIKSFETFNILVKLQLCYGSR